MKEDGCGCTTVRQDDHKEPQCHASWPMYMIYGTGADIADAMRSKCNGSLRSTRCLSVSRPPPSFRLLRSTLGNALCLAELVFLALHCLAFGTIAHYRQGATLRQPDFELWRPGQNRLQTG